MSSPAQGVEKNPMKDPLSCLTGLVGVADTECACYENGRPDDYNEATSGLYLSQLVDLDFLGQAYQCASGTIWTAGASAIKEATLLFQNNLLQCWAGRHKAREKWDGLIGQRDCTRPMTITNTYAGFRFKPHEQIDDGEIVISNIATIFSQTGEITVRIYNQYSDTYLYEVTLDTLANKFQGNPLATPIVLPFSDAGGDPMEYRMIYTVSSNRPLEGDANCGCSSKQVRMKEWAEVHGVTGNTIADTDDWTIHSSHYGLLPTVTFRCKSERSICDDTIDFATNPNAGVIAEAIWYMAASKIPDLLRRSSKVLPSNLMNDEMKADAEKYKAEYSARVLALCKTMKPNSCYVCKPGMGRIDRNF